MAGGVRYGSGRCQAAHEHHRGEGRTETRGGRLKLVSVWSSKRSIRQRVEAVLRLRAGDGEVSYLHGRVFLVSTDADPAAIRDWLAPELGCEDAAFIAEFERWSSIGTTLDRAWPHIDGEGESQPA